MISAFVCSITSAAAQQQESTPTDSDPAASVGMQESPEPETKPEPGVTLPVPISTSVQTIEGDFDPSRVVLALSLDENGDVVESKLISGEEPFASAALRSTSSWKFVPAKKSGKAVPVKIRFAVDFFQAHPRPEQDEERSSPTVRAPPVHEKPSSGSSEPKPEVASEPEEVVVFGRVYDPSATSITRDETRNLAGAFDDPLRAIEAMPGVTPIATGLPLFFVRGAPPANVGYYVDGIRLPQLYHAFLGPSVIHPAFIRKVDLSAGPMPAEYGRFAGAAVEAHLEPPQAARKAEASVRLIDAGAYAQSPFAKNKGYVQLGGRYSYTALLISLFAPGQRLDYWDYQALVGYNVTKRDEISLFGLGSYDYVGQDGEVLGGTEYHRADLRWAHRFSDTTKFRLAVTYGHDRTRSSSGYLRDRLVGSRLNFEHQEEEFIFRAGTDVWVDSYDMDVDPIVEEPETYLELFPARTDVQGGMWLDFVLFPSSPIRVIPGIRADVFSSLGQVAVGVDPRLSAEMRLTKHVSAVHSIGIAHQSPNFVPNVPGAQVGGLGEGLQRSLQAATKYEFSLPQNMKASVTGFINGTDRLTDPIGLGQSFNIDETSAQNRSLGRAFGLEFFFKRPLTRRLGGLLSYTFSRSLRSFDSITTKPGYDRAHVVNGALSYLIGWGFRASLKLAFASGIPGRRTTIDGFVFDESRSRPYLRLDAKVEKRFEVSEHFNWGIHAEVLNATNTGNVTARKCTPRDCEDEGTAPITLPSIGFDFAWE